MVLVSHQLPVLKELCNRIVWIDDGTVRRMGDVSELLSEYTAPNKKQRDNYAGAAVR